MAKLNDNTLVLKNGAPVSLLQGEDVPDWAKDQVGEHLLEGKAADEKPAGNASQEAWANYALESGQASEDEVKGLSRDELRELYG